MDSSGLGGGPTARECRAAQRDEFGDIEEFARKKSGAGYFVNERGLLRHSRARRELIVVPEVLLGAVLDALNGSKLSGHSRVRRTTDRLCRSFRWPGWRQGVEKRLRCCVACTATKAAQPAKHAKRVVYHPQRRFQKVTVDVQSVTWRTSAGSTNVLVIVDTFTRFAREIPILDERADSVAKWILDEWVSIFGPMENLLSDRGPNFIGTVIKKMAEQLGVRRRKSSPLHPQANCCVERCNRTLIQDVSCFMSAGSED